MYINEDILPIQLIINTSHNLNNIATKDFYIILYIYI